MKVGQNTIKDTVQLYDTEDEILGTIPEQKKEKRTGNVQLKFTNLPPNAEEKDCLLAESFPYMKFPFKYFNPMQSEFIPQVTQDNNVVVCGRTSAGKTIVAETITAYTLQELRKTDPRARVAYISPLKALASEKQDDWTNPGHDFYQYNISILTGDYILTAERKRELAEADIICMSSEMLGSRIRRNKTEKNLWINEIRTLVVDESHLLTVQERGPNLEVALMKFTAVNPNCRIIFLSATMPNVEELGKWLTKLNNKPTTIIRSAYRPVELNWNFEPFRTVVYSDRSGAQRTAYKPTESNKILKAVEVIEKHPSDKFICFVHGKKTGRAILEILGEKGISSRFHNADLNKEARAEIEASFRSREPGSLRVLVSTSTLAWGLNMPARRVLIVGLHRGMSFVEPLDIIQMGGRAGRVGLDTHGDVHVLIRDRFAMQDRDFCTIIQPIVSKIADISALAFHLVAEISEGTVRTLKEAIAWFLRSLAHHQGVLEQGGAEFADADQLVRNVVERLCQCGAVKEVDGLLAATPIGKIASWFYFSPFDVADWASNFKRILKTRNPSDHELAWAIANTFSNKSDYPVELNGNAMDFTKDFPDALRQDMVGGVEKHTYAIFCLLRGKDHKDIVPELSNIVTGYRIDSERIGQTLSILGSFGRLFNDLPGQDALLEVPYRIKYGLNTGIELLVLPGVGRVTALQVMERGVKNCKELLAAQNSTHKVFSDSKWEKIKDTVTKVARLGHIEYLKRLNKRKKEVN